jgi:hypothetical protein
MKRLKRGRIRKRRVCREVGGHPCWQAGDAVPLSKELLQLVLEIFRIENGSQEVGGPKEKLH